MKTITDKFRDVLRNWLFRQEITDIKRLLTYKEQSRQYIEEARNYFYSSQMAYSDAQRMISKCLDVGIDHGIKSQSWAVICIKGKPETVRFMQLESKDAQELRQFLKHLEGANIVFDSPFSREFYKI
jgi:hypothetical protein